MKVGIILCSRYPFLTKTSIFRHLSFRTGFNIGQFNGAKEDETHNFVLSNFKLFQSPLHSTSINEL